MTQAFSIRPEHVADNDTIHALQMAAFGPGAAARAAFRVREQAAHDPALSFVLCDGGVLLGSVRQTHVTIGAAAGLLLGPLVVEPAHKNNGYGRALSVSSSWSAIRPITARSASTNASGAR